MSPSVTSDFLVSSLFAAFFIESIIADVRSVWAAFCAEPDIFSFELASSLASIYFIILSVNDSFSELYALTDVYAVVLVVRNEDTDF